MRERSRLWACAFLAPAVAVYGLFVVLPIVQSAWISFFDVETLPTKAPRFVGWGNYAWLLHDRTFWRALGNNVTLVVVSLVVQLPIAMGLAVLLSYVRRGRGLFRTAFFAPMVLPTVAIALLWKFIYLPDDGLIDRFMALFGEHEAFCWLAEPGTALLAVAAAICWRYVGFHMVLFMAGVESIPEQLYEAARVDGAGEWRVLWHITLPHLVPVARISAVLSIVGSLKYFDLIWVMTGGDPAHASELVATYVYKTGFEAYDGGRASALAVTLMVLALAATLATSLLRRRGGDDA